VAHYVPAILRHWFELLLFSDIGNNFHKPKTFSDLFRLLLFQWSIHRFQGAKLIKTSFGAILKRPGSETKIYLLVSGPVVPSFPADLTSHSDLTQLTP